MKFILWLFLVSGISLSSAHSSELFQLQIDSFESEYLNSGKVDVNISLPSQKPGHFRVRVHKLQLPYLNSVYDLNLDCSGTGFKGSVMHCSGGGIEMKGSDSKLIKGKFSAEINLLDFSGDVTVQLSSENLKLVATYKADHEKNWTAYLSAQGLSLPIFSDLLSHFGDLFAQHNIVDGVADLVVDAKGTGTSIVAMNIESGVNRLSIDGENIFESVALNNVVTLDFADDTIAFDVVLELSAGEMYIQPGFTWLEDKPGFYMELDEQANHLHLNGVWQESENKLRLNSFIYEHPGLIAVRGKTGLKVTGSSEIQNLDLLARVDDLSKAFPIYIQPMLLQTNFSNLEIAGAVGVELQYAEKELHSMRISLEEVYIDDLANRFSVYDLNSDLKLGKDSSEVLLSSLDWANIGFYKLEFGQGNIVFESEGKDVRVLNWENVSLLDGGLKIDNFRMRNLASADFEMDISGQLLPISMQEFTHALGWTVFPGQLSGEISGLRYSHNRLELDGNISMNLFGGHVYIQELEVNDIFSSYSTLNTDIKIDALDLEQITDVFSFGKIEGSLSGGLRNLRLEDWQPSYFEAEVFTPEEDEKPHRISQKALENLNELGVASAVLYQGAF